MRRWEAVVLGVLLILAVFAAASCGHVPPRGDVRAELRADMQEYENCSKTAVDAMESIADTTEYIDNTPSCGGGMCTAQPLACAASDAQDMQQISDRMNAIQEKWSSNADLTVDEITYRDAVYDSCADRIARKSVQLYARSQGGCAGCIAGCISC